VEAEQHPLPEDEDEDPAEEAGPGGAGAGLLVLEERQLLRILRRMTRGGSKKLANLESTIGSEWKTWRSHFETVRTINTWGDARSQLEVKAAMMGEAARLTQDIPINVADVDVRELLNIYQERFLPAAEGAVARIEFQTAHQRPEENIAQYHGRIRELYIRAFPNNDDINHDHHLINGFLLGLADAGVGQHAMGLNPRTFDIAKDMAQQRNTTVAAFRLTGRRPQSINALTPRNGNRAPSTNAMECWHCRGDHPRSKCVQYKQEKDYFNKSNNNRGQGRPRFRRDNKAPRRNGKGQFINNIDLPEAGQECHCRATTGEGNPQSGPAPTGGQAQENY